VDLRSTARLCLLRLKTGEVADARALEAARAVAVQRFDLDHLGPQVGQHQATGRAHDHVGQLKDFDAAQGEFVGGRKVGVGEEEAAAAEPVVEAEAEAVWRSAVIHHHPARWGAGKVMVGDYGGLGWRGWGKPAVQSTSGKGANQGERVKPLGLVYGTSVDAPEA
jgi:hypothetical protein